MLSAALNSRRDAPLLINPLHWGKSAQTTQLVTPTEHFTDESDVW